jgi:hypothetical protein
LATSLTAWLRHIAFDGDLAKAGTKTLRFRVLSAPGRMVTRLFDFDGAAPRLRPDTDC